MFAELPEFVKGFGKLFFNFFYQIRQILTGQGFWTAGGTLRAETLCPLNVLHQE
jgi:hypothetical protein